MEKNLEKSNSSNSVLLFMPWLLQTLVWPITRPALRFFTGFKIKGLENLEGIKKPIIFAPNHANWIDPILVPSALTFFSKFEPIYYLAHEHFFNKFITRWWFKIWGSYPVFRGLNDYEKALKFFIKLLEKGESICYFPEGRRTRTGTLQKGKPGIAYLTRRTHATVIPVGIKGTYGLTFRSLFSRKNKISIVFGSPIKMPNPGDDFQEGADRVMESIKDLLLEN